MIIEALYGDVGPQCSVVSNFMKFDKAGHLIAFYDPLVHMFNKNAEHLADQTEYRAAVADRPNVLLLGDSLGDVTMADGQASSPQVVLRIGFLNSKVDDLLEQYMEAFDVVVLNDDSAEIAVKLLEECAAHTAADANSGATCETVPV
jgi:5'-nucleotidase